VWSCVATRRGGVGAGWRTHKALVLVARLFDQHDWDAVTYRKSEAVAWADQLLRRVVVIQGPFANWANQKVKQA
jgi:uncharacterized protein YPO0396